MNRREPEEEAKNYEIKIETMSSDTHEGIQFKAGLIVGNISTLSKLTGYLRDIIAYNVFYEPLANPYVLSSGPWGFFIEPSHIAEATKIFMTNR